MNNKKSVFETLSEIDISTLVRQKGNFWYLSWAQAVRKVSKVYPSMSWEIHKFDGLPYLKTETGYYVEASVTIEGKTRSQLMPVLDFKNKAHMSPSAFDINKSQQRALAKAISLHGLGLELWAGEDLEDNGTSQVSDSINKNDIEDHTNSLKSCKTMEELKSCFMSIPKELKSVLDPVKNAMKEELGASNDRA